MQTDRDLVEAVRHGNHAAFAELVRRYERVAAATAWVVLRDYHLTQDAIQNAFVEAFRRLSQLRSAEHFGAWVVRIARREAMRLATQARRTRALGKDVEADSAITTDPPADEWGQLLCAIGELPDHERIVVGMRYLEGHSVAEIADVTGRPPGTVSKQLSRAVKRLKFTLTRSESPT